MPDSQSRIEEIILKESLSWIITKLDRCVKANLSIIDLLGGKEEATRATFEHLG